MAYTMFQSAPDPKAGRYMIRILRIESCINVSIRSRPEGREIPKMMILLGLQFYVSIRSRPEGREIQVRSRGSARGPMCFNPLPTRRPGDTQIPDIRDPHSQSFNPLPTRRPGDTEMLQSRYGLISRFNPLPTRRPGDTVLMARC